MTHSPWTIGHTLAELDHVIQSVHRLKFGARVRQLRQERGLAQEQFAHLAGMDRTYVSGIERGRRNPTLDIIVRLAEALEVEPAELLTQLSSAGEAHELPHQRPARL